MPTGIYKRTKFSEEKRILARKTNGWFRNLDKVKNKMRLAKLGKIGNRLGYKATQETVEKLRISHIGQIAWNKGMKFPNRSGVNHFAWKGGLSSEKKKLKVSTSWKEWRKAVFKRDGYRCIDCGENGYLEPHHIIPLKQTLSRVFDKNNGITLCRPCHLKTLGKEMELASTYSLFVPYYV